MFPIAEHNTIIIVNSVKLLDKKFLGFQITDKPCDSVVEYHLVKLVGLFRIVYHFYRDQPVHYRPVGVILEACIGLVVFVSFDDLFYRLHYEGSVK